MLTFRSGCCRIGSSRVSLLSLPSVMQIRVPHEVLMRWYGELREWLRQHGVETNPNAPIPNAESLPVELQSPYRRHRFHKWNDHLEDCHGACHLRKRDLAEIVLNTLRHFDADRYELDCCIVMRNHVHLLAAFHLPTTCRGQSESWLHYTAFLINKALNQKVWCRAMHRGPLTDNDKLVYVNNVILGKLLESKILIQQALNNSKEQFANSPDLDNSLMNAIVEALDAHNLMSSQALSSESVRRGLKAILLGPAELYEALREQR